MRHTINESTVEDAALLPGKLRMFDKENETLEKTHE